MTVWTIPAAGTGFAKQANMRPGIAGGAQGEFPALTLPMFVAIRASDDTIENSLGLWKSRFDRFFQLGPSNLSIVSRSRGLAMISIQPMRRLFDVPLVHIDGDDHVASAHYLAQETPDEAWRNDSSYLKQAFRVDTDSANTIWQVSPPAAICAHSLRTGTMRLCNDFLGTGKIYYRRSTGIDVFSTKLASIPIVLDDLPATDERAWQLYSSFDWITDDSTFFSTICLLAAGSTVRLTPEETRIGDTHSVGRLICLTGTRELEVEQPVPVLLRRFDRIVRFARTRRAEIGFSGGRDSRVIASLAIARRADVSYITSVPPDLEAEIARKLIASSPVAMDWTIKRRALSDELPRTSLQARAAAWFAETEGDCWPMPLRADYFNELEVSKIAAVPFLSGLGGESLRAFSYKATDIGKGADRIRWMFTYRRNYNAALTQEAREVAAQSLRPVFDAGSEFGIEGLYLLDWFFISSRLRRRPPVAFQFTSLFPLFDASVYLAAYHRDPASKATARFQQDVVNELVPGWREVPYFEQLASSRSNELINKTKSLRYHWETMDRGDLLEFLSHALEISRACYSTDSIDQFRTVERGSDSAIRLNASIDKLAWRTGFEAYRTRLADTLGRPPVEASFDLVVGAGGR